MDFNGPNHSIRVTSVHEGVSIDEIRDNTGFDIFIPEKPEMTLAPHSEQIELIQRIDPFNKRLA